MVACFTPFGLTGPYAGYRADDITLYALGGPMIQTGVREREPLKLAGNQIQYQWGAVGAVATLGAVLRPKRRGRAPSWTSPAWRRRSARSIGRSTTCCGGSGPVGR